MDRSFSHRRFEAVLRAAFAPLGLVALGAVGAPGAARPQVTITPESVRIHYDAQMVPHVFGSSDESTLYGLGYHQAIDFPIGTLNLLWLHSARMAELAGSSYLDEDRLLRLWDVPAVADRHEAELAAAGLLPLIDAYVAGIEAGRTWWRGSDPTGTGPRYEALLGPLLRARFDPVPVYLNPLFSPYGELGDPQVPVRIRRVLARMFDASMPITRDHVLRLGVAISSGFLYRGDAIVQDVMPGSGPHPPLPAGPQPVDSTGGDGTEPAWYPQTTGQALSASNSWLVAGNHVQSGDVWTLSDNHVAFNALNVRAYLLQVEGPSYRVSGVTMPGYPALYQGYDDRFSWAVTALASHPVVSNLWEVPLLPSLDPNDLAFEFEANGSIQTVALETVTENLPWYDPASQQVFLYADRREYVPVQPAEGSGLVFTRYPVLPDDELPPLPGETIRFGQHAFSAEGSPWELWLRLGRAQNATTELDAILDDVLLLFGSGLNLVVADRDQDFRYLYMTRCPIQGPEVLPEEWDFGAVLDGSHLGERWQGFHDVSELPSMAANVAGTSETWIQNNVTPDVVDELQRIPDLTVYPGYMVPQETITTFRQQRAAELLRDAGTLSIDELDGCASDQTDAWTRAMWPLWSEAASLGTPSTDAQDLLAWLEQHRHDDEEGFSNPRYDFVAHVFSQATVYAVQLRSHYRDRLAALNDEDLQGGGPGLTPEQLALGVDPLHPVLQDPDLLGSGAYGPNLQALGEALETVAALWKKGSGPEGLQNQSVLKELDKRLGLGSWEDSRYASLVEPPWDEVIEGERVTRWGHVNVLATTPHHLGAPRRTLLESFVNLGEDPLLVLRGYQYSALLTRPFWPTGLALPMPVDPGQFPGLPRKLTYATLRSPFLSHDVWVWPVGGTDESLWENSNLALYSKVFPRDYQEAVYRWNAEDFLFYVPKTAGSVVTFGARLSPTGAALGAHGRFLASLGGTEITVPDLLHDGSLAYQQRTAPTKDFAERNWRNLPSQESALGAPRYVLSYP